MTSNVSNIQVNRIIDDNQLCISLTWDDPSDISWTKTVVVRKTNGYPTNVNDGTIITTNLSVDQYSSSSFMDKDVEPEEDYYYGIFPCDKNGEYNYNLENTCLTISDVMSPQNIDKFSITPDINCINITWNDPNDIDWLGTKLIRKINSEPINENDGTILLNCTTKNQYSIDDAKFKEPFKDKTAVPYRNYYYRLFPYDKLNNYNYKCESKQGKLLDITPPRRVTDSKIIPHKNYIELSWGDPKDEDWAGTKIMRKSNIPPIDQNDADAITILDYKKEDDIDYSINPYKDNLELQNNCEYYYGIFPYDTSDNFNTETILITNPLNSIPPSEVNNIEIDSIIDIINLQVKNHVELSWEDPDDEDWQGTKVIRKFGSQPENENDGVLIIDYNERNKYKTDPLIDSDDSLQNGCEYYYGIFPYNKTDDNYNYNTNINNIIDIELKYNNVTNLAFTPMNNSINIKYSNPTNDRLTKIKLLRKLYDFPIDQNDGNAHVVFNSIIEEDYSVIGYNDNNLSPNTVYYYKIYVYDDSGNVFEAGKGICSSNKLISFGDSNWSSNFVSYTNWDVVLDIYKNNQVLSSGEYIFKGEKTVVLKEIDVPDGCTGKIIMDILINIYNEGYYGNKFTIYLNDQIMFMSEWSFNWSVYEFVLATGKNNIKFEITSTDNSIILVKLDNMVVNFSSQYAEQ